MIEYALIACLIGVCVIVAVQLVGVHLASTLRELGNALVAPHAPTPGINMR